MRPLTDFAPRLKSSVSAAFKAGSDAISRQALEEAIKNRDEHQILSLMSDAVAATEKLLRKDVPGILKEVFNASGHGTVKALLHSLKIGRGNGSNQYQQKGGADKDKQRAAKESHKAVDMRTRAMAAESEKQLTKMLGSDAKRTEDTQHNAPFDVLKGKRDSLEVKTMTTNSKDKITMHPSSKDRKEAWAAANRTVMHTIIFDKRDEHSRSSAKNYSGNKIYYKRGVGSFRLRSMTPVKNAAHLRELMRSK